MKLGGGYLGRLELWGFLGDEKKAMWLDVLNTRSV
jgi:hypothetical protein